MELNEYMFSGIQIFGPPKNLPHIVQPKSLGFWWIQVYSTSDEQKISKIRIGHVKSYVHLTWNAPYKCLLFILFFSRTFFYFMAIIMVFIVFFLNKYEGLALWNYYLIEMSIVALVNTMDGHRICKELTEVIWWILMTCSCLTPWSTAG